MDVVYERGDSVWLEHIFGLINNMPAVQEVGGINGRQGRAISWPNALQHKLRLQLKDPSKLGHCKLLNLMLVDPNIRIISTANMPPQRLDWKDDSEQAKRDGDFPWSPEEAEEILIQAREQHKAFNHYQDVAFHSKFVSI
jgi:hypothetical protein